MQTEVMDWIVGEFDIVWADRPPAEVQPTTSGQRVCDLADARLMDNAVLVLRLKVDERLVYCAPNAWVTITTAPARTRGRYTAPRRIPPGA